MLKLHEMFIAAIKLAFKNRQNYTLQIYHILKTIQRDIHSQQSSKHTTYSMNTSIILCVKSS